MAGGVSDANWLFFLGAFGWLFTAIAVWALCRQQRRRELTAVAVLTIAAAGVPAWYQLLAGHTLQHILFMVRPLALIPAYGMAAALLVVPPIIRAWGYRRCAAAALICAVLAAAALHRPWMIDNATLGRARIIVADVDIASCAALGLRADGVADGVIEFEYELHGRPPLATVGLPANHTAHIALGRTFPDGVYHTGRSAFVLAIAEQPGGRPLNRTDGTLPSLSPGRHRLYAHFCRDGHERPDSAYWLVMGDVAVQVQPIGAR
jgi:hypothetical protein